MTVASTTTRARNRRSNSKHKLDLQAILDAGPAHPEPKTLDECLAEAGGYPFTAVALTDVGLGDGPDEQKGFVFHAVGPCPIYVGGIVGAHHPYLVPSGDRIICSVKPVLKRWQLLGHIPVGGRQALAEDGL